MDPVTLMVVGTGMEVLGRYGANIQQAIAEAANAKFYAEQERFNIMATQRAMETAARESGFKIGQAVTTYGASGVDVGSGSAITNLATMIADGIAEVEFARRKGELDIQLARMRGNQAQQTADLLASPGYNLIQAGTATLKNMTAAGYTDKFNVNQANKQSYSSGSVLGGSSYLTGSSQGSGTGYLGADVTF